MAESTETRAKLRARAASRVRVTEQSSDSVPQPHKRKFLLSAAACGGALPAAYFMFGNAASALAASAVPMPSVGAGAGTVRIVRDFAAPRLELVHLLREAAEIEHSLMIQYLYGAFSLKPAYQVLTGHGNPNSNDLLGVAIQEMEHLSAVNELLMSLGAAPVLMRQDFPYEPDIYPFALNLEPLSRDSLAKYAYTEAPAAALDASKAVTPADLQFLAELSSVLGSHVKPNLVGSLYSRVIETLREFMATEPAFAHGEKWVARLETIKDEGEHGHFTLFKSVFMGTHKAFKGQPNAWHLPKSDERYPALALPTNPSAYVHHENQIEDPVMRKIAWLGNLHYWSVLMLLDNGYRHKMPANIDAAKMIMMGPFWSLARALPGKGVGMPFDQLSMGYSPGVDGAANGAFIESLLQEIEVLEAELERNLPPDYPMGMAKQAVETVAFATPPR